jgi:hypothetical protein
MTLKRRFESCDFRSQPRQFLSSSNRMEVWPFATKRMKSQSAVGLCVNSVGQDGDKQGRLSLEGAPPKAADLVSVSACSR